jgi:anthranilate synthase component 2
MLALIDSYDSFSYNLYQLFGALGPDIRVFRNDGITVEELGKLDLTALILSPGPGRPCDAGILEDAVRAFSGKVPILGVCLGHQAIVEAFGGTITYAPEPMHGKASLATLDPACPLFSGIASPAQVARYHSLAADERAFPACLKVTARADDGQVMAVQHTGHPTFGVQFHPESVMTPAGPAMAKSFLEIARRWREGRV